MEENNTGTYLIYIIIKFQKHLIVIKNVRNIINLKNIFCKSNKCKLVTFL